MNFGLESPVVLKKVSAKTCYVYRRARPGLLYLYVIRGGHYSFWPVYKNVYGMCAGD